MKSFVTLVLGMVFVSAQAKHHDKKVSELEKKVEVLASEIESLRSSKSESSEHGKLRFGGYGEFTYNNKRSELENGSKTTHSDNPNWDALRYILYTSYDFNKNWKLFAEIEIEHADEIFLEQAFLSYVHSPEFQLNIGVLLLPVGYINVFHEPTRFFATKRTDIESKIIPSTWRENGVSVSGAWNNFEYTVGLYNSLHAGNRGTKNGFTSDGVRNGRQKASKAVAKDLSVAARLDYKLDGLGTFGASAYMGEGTGVTTDVTHKIYDVHAEVEKEGFTVRAMYVLADIGKALELSQETGEVVSSEMSGYQVELGYNVLHYHTTDKLTPFVRYEAYDTHADVDPAAGARDLSKDRTNLTFGLNYQPVEGVVLKADYTIGKNEAETGYDSWNLGAGWVF